MCKRICNKMVPKKILNNDFPDDVLVIHIRSGDIY